MRIRITDVLSLTPRVLHDGRTHAYRVRFTSDVVAGQARFIPSDVSVRPVPEQQYTVETGYDGIAHGRIWTAPDAPTPRIDPRVQPEAYDLVARVIAMTPRTEDSDLRVAVAVGDCAFVFTAQELGGVLPRVGDIMTCTVEGLSLWDEGW